MLFVLWLLVQAPGKSFAVPANLGDSVVLARTMPKLAGEVWGRYSEADPLRRLDNLFRLQITIGRYEAAAKTVSELRAARSSHKPGPEARAADLQYEIWTEAKATGQLFATVFRQRFRSLDDRTAVLAIRAMSVSLRGLEGALRAIVQGIDGRTEISESEALGLVRAWQRVETHRDFAPLLPALIAEDDARRYVSERDLRIKTPDGGPICALLVRPKTTRRVPALLMFTIYVDSTTTVPEARRAAANGYAGVVGYTRGKACSPDLPAPYRTDGKDAAALINWIAAQPWSDESVGMYGGSYNGFTTWAATKYLPRALKAIMVGAPVGPGLDVPMEGNVVLNFLYPWPFYTTNNKTLDNATYFDNNRWFRLSREWYRSGRPYKELEQIDGTPNPVFDEWIAHSSYDAYWSRTIPYGADFAKLQIPVLQTAGYFYGGPGAAVYYLTQHYAHDPAAQHYLLIGPWDHPQGQRGVVDALGDTTTVIAGYETDPVSRIDIVAELRYRWFDWILKHGPRPALLQDRINYEVLGANRWEHAPSIAAMANGSLRFYLSGDRLTRSPGSDTELRVNLADRSDVDSIFPGGAVRDSAVNRHEALVSVSDPLDREAEVSGLFSGHFEFTTNKKDFDLSVQLFELTERGEYCQLPPLQIRASYARDLSIRHLLTPGARETLDIKSIRLISRRVAKGSRIVAVIGPIKGLGAQINYGTGKEVNDESIADAGEPLTIRWFGSSYLELPVRLLPPARARP